MMLPFVPFYNRFTIPSNVTIPDFYWDSVSSEQRLYEIARRLRKIIYYLDHMRDVVNKTIREVLRLGNEKQDRELEITTDKIGSFARMNSKGDSESSIYKPTDRVYELSRDDEIPTSKSVWSGLETRQKRDPNPTNGNFAVMNSLGDSHSSNLKLTLTVGEDSTNTQIPTASAVYDAVVNGGGSGPVDISGKQDRSQTPNVNSVALVNSSGDALSSPYKIVDEILGQADPQGLYKLPNANAIAQYLNRGQNFLQATMYQNFRAIGDGYILFENRTVNSENIVYYAWDNDNHNLNTANGTVGAGSIGSYALGPNRNMTVLGAVRNPNDDPTKGVMQIWTEVPYIYSDADAANCSAANAFTRSIIIASPSGFYFNGTKIADKTPNGVLTIPYTGGDSDHVSPRAVRDLLTDVTQGSRNVVERCWVPYLSAGSRSYFIVHNYSAGSVTHTPYWYSTESGTIVSGGATSVPSMRTGFIFGPIPNGSNYYIPVAVGNTNNAMVSYIGDIPYIANNANAMSASAFNSATQETVIFSDGAAYRRGARLV